MGARPKECFNDLQRMRHVDELSCRRGVNNNCHRFLLLGKFPIAGAMYLRNFVSGRLF
jgi:hypothetical protein